MRTCQHVGGYACRITRRTPDPCQKIHTHTHSTHQHKVARPPLHQHCGSSWQHRVNEGKCKAQGSRAFGAKASLIMAHRKKGGLCFRATQAGSSLLTSCACQSLTPHKPIMRSQRWSGGGEGGITMTITTWGRTARDGLFYTPTPGVWALGVEGERGRKPGFKEALMQTPSVSLLKWCQPVQIQQHRIFVEAGRSLSPQEAVRINTNVNKYQSPQTVTD